MKCKQGDLAIIKRSIEGAAVGKIVQCISYDGDHSQYGPMWKVRAKEDLVTEYGGVGKEVHMPDDWLEPIKPPPLPVKQREKEKDLA